MHRVRGARARDKKVRDRRRLRRLPPLPRHGYGRRGGVAPNQNNSASTAIASLSNKSIARLVTSASVVDS